MSAEEQSQQQERSLYRRHRPRAFDEVVGQEPVVRTLRNAVQQGKVHHAYLFVGSRGTGKTSMAKILAACLNCERGPTIEPCGQCQSCTSIASATSLDVIEMDAASNNSVDDIRELRESVAFAPVSGRRKVYILDEAHMLSTAAWNAFLKTLEEPPPGTVFVLATTEAAKVPATVVDRCHRFDFHRPTVEQIALVLRRSAEAESISIPPPAVAAIARSATGSFRDALGTLEQLVTYSGPQIAVEDVLAVLGVADSRLLAEAVDAAATGDSARALRALAECVEQGRDASSFAGDLEVRCRELLVVQALGEVPRELSLTAEADAALSEQAERVDHATVVRLLELLGEAMEGMRAGADPRTRLELALVKAARPETDNSLKALLARIERLEHGLGTGTGAAGAVANASPGAGRPATSAGAPLVADAADAATPSPSPPATGASATATASAAAVPAASPQAAAPPAEAAEVATTPRTETPPQPPPATAAAPDADGEHPMSPAAHAGAQPAATAAPSESAPAAVAVSETVTIDARDLPQDDAEADWLGSIRSLWPAVVDLVRGEHAMLGALIEDARPVALEGDNLMLAFEQNAHLYKKKAEDPDNRAIVGEALRSVTGSRWRLSYELRELAAEDEGEAAGEEQSDEHRLTRFMEEFEAEEIHGEWEASGSAPSEDAEAVASNQKGAGS